MQCFLEGVKKNTFSLLFTLSYKFTDGSSSVFFLVYIPQNVQCGEASSKFQPCSTLQILGYAVNRNS